ncbi:alpha-glycosidase [Marinicrinis sediminis]|uniref:Alpha-glycosidase n=1 Tax=Marinicrinis sediminis TaxID=1652465 RepID=A0ABW5R9P1_9BACL
MDLQQEAIYHVPKDEYSYPLDEQTLKVTIRVKKGDIAGGKVLFTDRYDHPQYTPSIEQVPLKKEGSDGLFEYWSAAFVAPKRRPKYIFMLNTGHRSYWYSELGLTADRPAARWFEFPYLAGVDLPHYPSWLDEAIFYQIGVDRFYNGNPDNDPDGALPWGDEPTMTTFFGGDLEGVIKKINYLTELGVNAVYFNPLFLSPSTFKYDTEDYYLVDPSFGGNEAFEALIQAFHKAGIKVVLDAVFNHAGKRFKPFQDVVEKGKDSAYYDWFIIHDWPINMEEPGHNYDTFAYTARMPKLNHEHPEVRQYLLDVTQFWTEKGIDGWRLDVANELDHQFWREFRMLVKSVNPEAFILGEIWLDGTTWLQGDQFDSITNYLFRAPVLDFFGEQSIGATSLDERLLSARIRYREQQNRYMFNLIGSHDVPRFLSLCEGSEERMALATVFLFMYPGIPMVYYGDEVGMTGSTMVQARRCMVWDEAKQNKRLFQLYQSCIQWRKQLNPLKFGDFETLYVSEEDQVYGFARSYENEAVWAFFHNGVGKRQVTLDVPEGSEWIDLQTQKTVSVENEQLQLELDAYEYALIMKKTI